MITQYPFPGNVRELSNTVERAVAFATEGWIRVEHLPTRIRDYQYDPGRPSIDIHALPTENKNLLSLAEVERQYIRHVMEKVGGNKRRAAGILGIGRRTLYRKISEFL